MFFALFGGCFHILRGVEFRIVVVMLLMIKAKQSSHLAWPVCGANHVF